jgi:hypothetical protein
MGKQRADVKNESVTETVTDLKEEYLKNCITNEALLNRKT